MKLRCSRNDIWVKWEKQCVVEKGNEGKGGLVDNSTRDMQQIVADNKFASV